jgi:predicted mannosyl-3-phosphoglycerate phosphatase (HAD superfamily)
LGKQKFYRVLQVLGWDFVIRFRGDILVEHGGGKHAAAKWLPPNDHAKAPNVAQTLLSLLDSASDASGLDRYLKANTVKSQTISLINQRAYLVPILLELA